MMFMKVKFVLLLILALLAGGCIEKLKALQENVPVLNAKVTMGEGVNGTMVIQNIEAFWVEMPRKNAPMDFQFPEKFPAVYVDIIQNTSKMNYQVGKSYNGPGVYNYTIGMEKELNKNAPAVLFIEAIDKTTNTVDAKEMLLNWSTEIQSKTFK